MGDVFPLILFFLYSLTFLHEHRTDKAVLGRKLQKSKLFGFSHSTRPGLRSDMCMAFPPWPYVATAPVVFEHAFGEDRGTGRPSAYLGKQERSQEPHRPDWPDLHHVTISG